MSRRSVREFDFLIPNTTAKFFATAISSVTDFALFLSSLFLSSPPFPLPPSHLAPRNQSKHISPNMPSANHWCASHSPSFPRCPHHLAPPSNEFADLLLPVTHKGTTTSSSRCAYRSLLFPESLRPVVESRVEGRKHMTLLTTRARQLERDNPSNADQRSPLPAAREHRGFRLPVLVEHLRVRCGRFPPASHFLTLLLTRRFPPLQRSHPSLERSRHLLHPGELRLLHLVRFSSHSRFHLLLPFLADSSPHLARCIHRTVM
jgi:hypothetical protein